VGVGVDRGARPLRRGERREPDCLALDPQGERPPAFAATAPERRADAAS
jgi:hypothetical protein